MSGRESPKAQRIDYNAKGKKGPKTFYQYVPDFSEDLIHAYTILNGILSNSTSKIVLSSFIDKVDITDDFYKDYHNVIKNPLWLKKIYDDLMENKYQTITEVVRDIRMLLANAYLYHGPSHQVSKRAHKLETILDQKLALLPKSIKEMTSMETTNPDLALFDDSESSDQSRIMNSVFARLQHSDATVLLIHRKSNVPARMTRQVKEQMALEWEEDLLKNEGKDMSSMWEIPQISIFVHLGLPALNIKAIPHFYIERFLLVPQASSHLGWLLMSLLSNTLQRNNLHRKKLLPYKKWNELVKIRVGNWYKILRGKLHTPKDCISIEDKLGISHQFFKILGLKNPLIEKDFHELTFHQRVWVLKSLCDNCFNKQRSVQDAVLVNSNYQRVDQVLGMDRNNLEYLFFPQLDEDLRIYRQPRHETNPDDMGNEELTPNSDKFCIVATNVASLRELISELESRENVGDVGVLQAAQCEQFLVEELKSLQSYYTTLEAKHENAENFKRMSLKKEWEDYQQQLEIEEEEEEQFEMDLEESLELPAKKDKELSPTGDELSEAESGEVPPRMSSTQSTRSVPKDEEDEDEEESFEISVSSRGRVRKLRKLTLDKNETVSLSNRKEEANDGDDYSEPSKPRERQPRLRANPKPKISSDFIFESALSPERDNLDNEREPGSPHSTTSTASAPSEEETIVRELTPPDGYHGRRIFVKYLARSKVKIKFEKFTPETLVGKKFNTNTHFALEREMPTSKFRYVYALKKVDSAKPTESATKDTTSTPLIISQRKCSAPSSHPEEMEILEPDENIFTEEIDSIIEHNEDDLMAEIENSEMYDGLFQQ